MLDVCVRRCARDVIKTLWRRLIQRATNRPNWDFLHAYSKNAMCLKEQPTPYFAFVNSYNRQLT